jgi:hypothetical protein
MPRHTSAQREQRTPLAHAGGGGGGSGGEKVTWMREGGRRGGGGAGRQGGGRCICFVALRMNTTRIHEIQHMMTTLSMLTVQHCNKRDHAVALERRHTDSLIKLASYLNWNFVQISCFQGLSEPLSENL